MKDDKLFKISIHLVSILVFLVSVVLFINLDGHLLTFATGCLVLVYTNIRLYIAGILWAKRTSDYSHVKDPSPAFRRHNNKVALVWLVIGIFLVFYSLLAK